MIGIILLALLVGMLALGISIVYDINVSIALPISFNGIMVVLYLFGLFNCLLPGVYIVVIIPILLIIMAIINKKMTKDIFLQRFLSPAIFLWIFSVVFVICIFNGRLIWMGDDLTHWALVVKNLYFNDKFCVGDNTYIYFTNYPEFSALPAYLSLKMNGSFNEGALYAAKVLWEVALLSPFCYSIKSKDIFKGVAAMLLIIFLPLFWGCQVMFWNTLQVDSLLGIAFSHCLILIRGPIKQNEKKLALISGIISLTLLKLTGVYFALFIIALLLVDYFCTEKINNKTKLKEIGVFAILALMAYSSWNIYLKLNNAEIWVNTNRYGGLEVVLNFLRGKGSAIRYDTLDRAIARIFSLRYVQIGAMNCYILWIIILIVGIIVVGYIKRETKKQNITYSILFILGFVCWWLGVLFVTLFKFSEEEMLILSSYDRYLQPYFIGILFAICGILFMEHYKNERLVIACLLTFIFVCTYKNVEFNWNYFYSSQESQVVQRNNIEIKCEEFLQAKEKGLINPHKDRIYIISQQGGALSADYYDAQFLIAPVPVSLLCSYNIPGNINLSYCLGNPYFENDIWTTQYTVEEFADVLKKGEYTYLLILTYDENFYDNYSSMFVEGIVKKGLFSIKQNGASIIFEHVKLK